MQFWLGLDAPNGGERATWDRFGGSSCSMRELHVRTVLRFCLLCRQPMRSPNKNFNYE
jgi:hypothetical protein